jgi:hypothetical protein
LEGKEPKSRKGDTSSSSISACNSLCDLKQVSLGLMKTNNIKQNWKSSLLTLPASARGDSAKDGPQSSKGKTIS